MGVDNLMASSPEVSEMDLWKSDVLDQQKYDRPGIPIPYFDREDAGRF